MYKNIFMKKLLKGTLFKIVSAFNVITPKFSKNILLYSAGKNISNNLIPLREILTKGKYKEKYKIICGIESKKYKDMEADNIVYTTPIKTVLYFLFSKTVFYTNGQIPIKPAKKQDVIYLCHGIGGLKLDAKMLKIDVGYGNYFKYFLSPADIYTPILAKEFECDEKDIFVCGEPVTDVFFQDDITKYDFGDYKKVLLWAPTFRQSDYLGYVDSSSNELLPMFADNDYDELNSILRRYNFLLVVKLHGGQNTKLLKKHTFSNLKIFTHEEFGKAGYYLYNLLPQIDVLLADYSSVYNQFLLLNKPIGFVIPDIEEYAEKRGFIFGDPEKYMPGEKIKDKDALYRFFDDIDKGIDKYETERLAIRDILHKYKDGNNCERIFKRFGINAD